jgi:hypothetical protein
MGNIAKIHQDKSPVRRHFLAEWLEERNMTPMDLVAALNDPDRSLDHKEVDKSQVYRWLKGQMPQAAQQLRLAALFGWDDPSQLLRHPRDDWFSRITKDRDNAEVESMKQAIEIMLKLRTGTGG